MSNDEVKLKPVPSHAFYVEPVAPEDSWFAKRQRLRLRRRPLLPAERRQLTVWAEFPRQHMAFDYQDRLPLADTLVFAMQLVCGALGVIRTSDGARNGGSQKVIVTLWLV